MLYKLLINTCSTTSNVASLSDLNTNSAEGTSQTSGALSVPGIVGGMFSGIRDKSPPSFVIQTTHPPLTPSPALVVDTAASDLAASQQASPSSTSLAVTTGRAHAASNSPKTDDTYATSTEVSSDIVDGEREDTDGGSSPCFVPSIEDEKSPKRLPYIFPWMKRVRLGQGKYCYIIN